MLLEVCAFRNRLNRLAMNTLHYNRNCLVTFLHAIYLIVSAVSVTAVSVTAVSVTVAVCGLAGPRTSV